MEEFVISLQREVQEKLDMIDPDLSPVKGYDRKKGIMKWAIQEMLHYPIKHPFENKETEINYFKYWMPLFQKQHHLFKALFELEKIKLTSDLKKLLSHLDSQREIAVAFIEEQGDLCSYHLAERSDQDEILYVHRFSSDTNQNSVKDINYCKTSENLGELLACLEYKDIIDGEISLLTNPKENVVTKTLKWTGTKTEAVELLTLCYTAKLFKNDEGEAPTLDQLRIWAKEALDVDLKNFSVLDNAGRNRKKSTTVLLDKFIQVSKARENRLDP